MNVWLPGGDHAQGPHTSFWVILGFMVALFVSMVVYFKRRGWL
jgi:Mg2+ and Co2+ transporter CorA